MADRKTPWTNFEAYRGYAHLNNDSVRSWDAANWPFIVRWSVANNDRLTRYRTEIREFQSRDEAVAAFNLGFTGIDAELLQYNGGKPGSHLTRIASRKCGKSTKWHIREAA